MNAVIIQEAKIFDPKKVPEYIREAVKWNLYLPLISEKERRTRETYESLRFERTRSLEATEINLGE